MRNVGDSVTIKSNLSPFESYGGIKTSLPMIAHLGKGTSIIGKKPFGESYIYTLDVDHGVWSWTEDMFEQAVEVAEVEVSKTDNLACNSTKVENINCDNGIISFEISADKIETGVIQIPTSKQKKEVKLEKRFKVGDRVIVKKSNEIENVDTEGKKKLVGAVGVVDSYGKVTSISHNGVLYEHSIRFEDLELQRSNCADGVWLFANEELAPASRVIVGENSKIIINYPAVIYVLECEGRLFKGVAKVMEGDAWDEERGIQISKTKAEIKMLQARLKALSK